MYGSATSYNPQSFIPQDWRGWDDYTNRIARYEVFTGYYHNLQYHTIISYSQGLKHTERLYKHVRGVYNPVKRLVDGYVSKIYGGVLDTQRGKSGSIPLDTDDDRLRDAITTLWLASNWGQKKSLYTRHGAKTGDSFLKVVDDLERNQVRLEVVDPFKVRDIQVDPDGTINRVELYYYIHKDGKQIAYQEIITPERFIAQTENGDPVHSNGRGEMITEWDNDYGFVPFVHVKHIDEGLMYGAPATHGLLHKINELNDLASILNDGMRKQVQMPLFTKNAQIGQLDAGTDQSTNAYNTADNPKKDTMSVINLMGENADIVSMAPQIRVADGIANIKEILQEIERDSPELSLHRIRESGNITAPGARSAYDDAISRYKESRGNYDTGLVEAQQMAVAIGGMRGYENYQGYGLMSLQDGSLEHQISDRPVINETMSLTEKHDYILRGTLQSMPKTYFLSIGVSETDAQAYEQAGQLQRDSFMLSTPFGQTTTTPELTDTERTPQEGFDIIENSGFNELDALNALELVAS
jgi:hypothetical protein